MEAGQDRLWLAREVVRSLVRALDSSKRGATPAPAAAPREEFAKSLRGFVRRHGRLQLAVTAAGLRLGADTLTDEQGHFAGLATDLLVGGVREIAVDPGITEAEVERFIVALDGEGDDAATRLLEVGFDHIDIDSFEFRPALDRPEAYSPEARARLQDMQKKADELARDLEAKGVLGQGPLVYEVTDSGGELRRLERIKPPPPSPADDEPPVAVPQDAVRTLCARALEASTSEAVLLSLVDYALQGFALDPNAIGAENAKWFVEAAPALAIREGNLHLLAAIIERFQMELTVSGGPVAAAVNAGLTALATKAGLEKLIALGSTGSNPEAFCQILEGLGENGITTALAAYQRTASKELREALSGFLSENIALAPDALRPLLQPTASSETAKFALFLVSKSLQGEVADRLYDEAKKYPKPAVAEYATFLWRTQTLKGRLAAFAEALEGSDVAERIRAVDALAKAKDREALEALVKLVQDPSFLTRTHEEMRAFMHAIGEIGGKTMIQFFEQQSARTTGIFRLRAGSELRDQAKDVLKKLGEEGK
jgi:hypothetical protein